MAAPSQGKRRANGMRLALAAVALLVLALGIGGAAMATMVLFSAVEGVVLQDGSPVPGATIEREFRWAWKDEAGTDTATTDATGKFRLPLIERSSLLGGLLPHEPMIRQTILIRHAGVTYKAWMFDKGNYEPNGELKGRPINLICRLEAPLHHSGEIYGICDLA